LKAKNEEISILRNITHRLNIELSAYQARYPSGLLQASLKKKEINKKTCVCALSYKRDGANLKKNGWPPFVEL